MGIPKNEKSVMLKLIQPTYNWLAGRAEQNRRSLLREAVDIVEAERHRCERRASRGAFHAKGGAA